jgi:hypothetical protein
MIRFLLRTLGLLFLASAFIFLVYDGTRSIAANLLVYTRADEVWSLLHAASLQQIQPWIGQHAPHWLAEPMTAAVLGAPATVILAVAGMILMLLGRRKKKLIGYGR